MLGQYELVWGWGRCMLVPQHACVLLQVRNVKPRTKEEQGQQKRVESLVHHSNVMHYSATQQVGGKHG